MDENNSIAQCNNPEIAYAGVTHPSTSIGNHSYGDWRSSFFPDHLQECWDNPLIYIANKVFETRKYSSLNTAFIPRPIIYNFHLKYRRVSKWPKINQIYVFKSTKTEVFFSLIRPLCPFSLYTYLYKYHPVCSLAVQIHTQFKSVITTSVCATPSL